MKTLVIAAHLDDESISCGGLIRTRVEQGADVTVLVLFGRVYDYGRESVKETALEEGQDFIKAKDILGFKTHVFDNLQEGEPSLYGYYPLLERVEKLLQSIAPDEVVIHGANDLNQDHRWLNHICRIALRPSNLATVTRVLEMLPLDGGGPITTPSFYVVMSRSMLDCKIAAVSAYRREARLLPHPRCPENIEAHARLMGSACGEIYAEAYNLVFQKEVHQ